VTTVKLSEAEWDFVQQCVAQARRQDEQRSAWKEYRANLREDALPTAEDFGLDPGDYWIALEKRSMLLFSLCCDRAPQYCRSRERRGHREAPPVWTEETRETITREEEERNRTEEELWNRMLDETKGR
jgi:hypothetical protein